MVPHLRSYTARLGHIVLENKFQGTISSGHLVNFENAVLSSPFSRGYIMRSYIMEFLGTMFLVLSIGLTGDPLAIGMTLSVVIYAGGHISGAHYNPAVTIAFWMHGKFAAKDIPGYIIMQILGAFIAAVLCYYLTGKTFAPTIGAEATVTQAIVCEILFTFLLVMVILNVAISSKLAGNYIYGFAIGFTVTASAYCVGGISGCVLNPAVGIGPIVLNEMNGGSSASNLYIYMIAPCIGGILAVPMFQFLNPDES